LALAYVKRSRCNALLRRQVVKYVELIIRSFLKIHSGFHGDLNETYAVGEIDEDSKKLIRTTREALDAAIAICKPGALFRDIGKTMSVLCNSSGSSF